MIKDNFNKDNLHHAYLIEGNKEEILPEIFELVHSFGIKTIGNPDFCQINLDSFKIEDARNLKSMGEEKAFTSGKKFFIISANNFLIEAQGTLLKIFEEPIENTHFFLIVPDANVLLPTLASRFYLIKSENNLTMEFVKANEFIALSLKDRISFIKELITEEKTEDDTENLLALDSPRSKSIKFLNALEMALHKKLISKNYTEQVRFFDQIFKARTYLRQPGSSTKSLLESVALLIPKL